MRYLAEYSIYLALTAPGEELLYGRPESRRLPVFLF